MCRIIHAALGGGAPGDDTSAAAHPPEMPAAPRWRIGRLSLGGQLTIFNMATSGVALLLACLALFAYDSASARKALLSDAGTLAVVIAENSPAAVAFEDVKAATGLLRSAALNPHVRNAMIVRRGIPFARYSRSGIAADMRWEGPLADAAITGHGAEAFGPESLKLVRPIKLDQELIGAIYLESDLESLRLRRNQFTVITALVLLGTCACRALPVVAAAEIHSRADSSPHVPHPGVLPKSRLRGPRPPVSRRRGGRPDRRLQ